MVAAVIVLYNPNMSLLDRLMRSVVGQVEKIFVVDNTPGSTAGFATYFDQFQGNLSYVPLGENKGIATAQNVGIRASMDAGYSHVLLLDQDSSLPEYMISNMLLAEAKLLRLGKAVAAVGPQFIDKKTGNGSFAIRCGVLWVSKIQLDAHSKEPVETDHLIASGSLIRAEVLNSVGLMRDDLFIDWVDIEWALRARSLGYKSYYIPNAVMEHSVGDSVVNILGRDVHIHNDTRNYYLLRNATYLMRLKSISWRWKITFAPRIPCYLILYPCLSNSKLKNAKLLIKAIMDGMRGRLGRIVEP